MKIISHRGNLIGREIGRENSPDYINEAVDAGFDVEVDVWMLGGELFFGHDEPQYPTTIDYLKSLPLWCHAKNVDALVEMRKHGLRCFWHDVDVYTLTSTNEIWCYANVQCDHGIMVCLGIPQCSPTPKYGVCTDFALEWKKWRDSR